MSTRPVHPEDPNDDRPPFHFKIPRENWRVFVEGFQHYLGKSYVDHILIGYSGQLSRRLRDAHRRFNRGEKSKRRAKLKPVTLLLERKWLPWLSGILSRAANASMAAEVPSYWGRFQNSECLAFNRFATESLAAFDREFKKTVVELIGDIRA